jgi:hypothetical protein
MVIKEDTYLRALIDMNAALITGLQSAIVLLEKYEGYSEEERKPMINKLKQLVDASHNVYRPEQTKGNI